MKKLLFLLVGALLAFSANAQSSNPRGIYCPPFCSCTQPCNCTERLEYAFMDEPNSNDTYVFLFNSCGRGPKICGVVSKPIVKLNIGEYNETDVTDEVLISWKAAMVPNLPDGQIDYTITYKIEGQVKTRTGSITHM